MTAAPTLDPPRLSRSQVESDRQRNPVGIDLRMWVIRRDGGVCQGPGCYAIEDLTADHRTPRSRGGRTDPDNLWTLCRRCNSSKRDRTVEEWPGRFALAGV